MGKKRSVFAAVKVLGASEDRGIPELSLIKVDLASLPAVTDEQVLLELLRDGEDAAEAFGNHFFSGLDWRALAPWIALKVKTTVTVNELPVGDRKKFMHARSVGLPPEYEELMACIYSVFSDADHVRAAIRSKDLFGAARWSLSFGDSVVRMHMMLHQGNAKAGRGVKQGRVNGGRATRMPEDERLERAQRFRDHVARLESEGLPRKAALKRVGNANGVSYKTVERALKSRVNSDTR